jgi:serine/threonine protein kinase
MNSDNFPSTDNNIEDYLNDPQFKEFDIIKNNSVDQICERYNIQLDKPIPALDGSFAKAYEIINNQSSNDFSLYCLIFEPCIPPRISVINYFKKSLLDDIIQPIECEITKISETGKEQLVVILKKPPNMTLEEYVSINGACTIQFIIENFLVPTCKLLQKFESAGLIHGKLNPSTIYINPTNGAIKIGECISEPPSYSQKQLYCAIEICECPPIARGTGDIAIDYYAIGIICLYLYLGRSPNENVKSDTLIDLRLENSSFTAITTGLHIPTNFKNLLKGLMFDRKTERWKSRNIIEWYNGQKNTLLNISENLETSRSLPFNKKSFFNCKFLAHDLQKNWELARKFIKEDNIVKWVERSINNTEMAEKLQDIRIQFSRNNHLIAVEKDECLIKFLSILDPLGPIRLKDVSINPHGLASLIAFGYIKNRKDYLENFNKAINSNFWLYNIELKSNENRNLNENNLSLPLLDRTKFYIGNKTLGFGLERCLYEFNPHVQCLSETFKYNYIITCYDLLKKLNNLAENDKNINIMDRHIAAFLLTKMNYQKDIKVNGLKSFFNFDHNKEIISVAILAIAQKYTNTKQLPSLCKVAVSYLQPAINLIHNNHTRTQLSEKLQTISSKGNLTFLLNILADPNLIQKDIVGFENAVNKYKKCNLIKIQLNNKQRIFEIGYRNGLRLCVIISYLLCSVLYIYLLAKGS